MLTAVALPTQYIACLTVWGMGHLSAADIAQLVHEELLSRHGVVDIDRLIRYGHPLDARFPLKGIYLDDLLILSLVPEGTPEGQDGHGDIEVARAADSANDQENVNGGRHQGLQWSLQLQRLGR